MPMFSERAGKWTTWILQGLLALMGVEFALQREWVLFLSIVAALAVSFSPLYLQEDWHVHVPWPLTLLITLSVFLHMGGLYTKAYNWFPYYDAILHFTVSLLIAFLALLFVYTMERYWEGFGWVSRPVLMMIIFLTTLALGALWEIMEFASDVLIGTTHQAGNLDTMRDLILDGTAGLAVALFGGASIRRGWLDPWSDEIGRDVRQAQKREQREDRREERRELGAERGPGREPEG